MITTQILTKNNEDCIQKTIDSISDLPINIVVVDLGSSDKTIEICKKNNANVFVQKNCLDYSVVRNKIVENSSDEWQMYINPWEILTEGKEIIKTAIEKQENYKFMILKGDVISKEIRLWRKSSGIKFERPIYEDLEPNNGTILNVMLYSDTSKNLGISHFDIINNWKDCNPLSRQIDYYLALTNLIYKKYEDFIRLADHYLFCKKQMDTSTLMIKYYCAKVYCYIFKNYRKAISNIIECIDFQPTMSEFWCVLGDSYLHMKEFDRARGFFENAIIFGNQRPPDDDLPLEISKYEEYPKKMISALSLLKTNSS